MNPTAPPSLSDRLVMTLEGLYAAVAARFRSPAISVAMIHLVCRRVRRVEILMVRLLEQFRAGTLPAEAAPVVRFRKAREAREVGVTPPRIPRRFGWLLQAVPFQAANYASQLRACLAEPEMVALLAASARARRAWAPVCRMLAIEAEVIAPEVIAPEVISPEGVAPEGVAAGSADAGTAVARPEDPMLDFRFFRDGSLALGTPFTGPS